MTVAPLPEPLDSEETITADVVYRDDTIVVERHAHPDMLGISHYSVALSEPVTPGTYGLLAAVLTLYASPDLVQCGEGDSIGGWLHLDFTFAEIPGPRFAS